MNMETPIQPDLPDEIIAKLGRPLVEAIRRQISVAASTGFLEETLKPCFRCGYMIGYVTGLSIATAGIACRDANVDRQGIGRAVLRLFDYIVENAFDPAELGSYRIAHSALTMQQPPGFQRGEYDGTVDAQAFLADGSFLDYLAARLGTTAQHRDDLFVAPIEEVTELALSGDSYAQIELGLRYTHGRGIERNLARACIQFLLATLGGHKDSRQLFEATAACLERDELREVRRLAERFQFECPQSAVMTALDHLFGRLDS